MTEVTRAGVRQALMSADPDFDAEIVSITQTPSGHPGLMGSIQDLEIAYGAGERGAAPERCLLKTVDPERFAIGRGEVEFYRLAAAHPQRCATLLPRTYGTLIDEDARVAFLLMADVGSGRPAPEWPVPRSAADCGRAVRSLAALHASWWSAPELPAMASARPLPQADEARLASCLGALIDKLGDALSAERRRLLEQVVEHYPARHTARLRASGPLTLVHGDAHLWNFVIPEAADEPARLIDWQLWGVDLGVADLAYMMALHWFPERRARFERDLVATYVETLESHGVDYPQTSGWADYRWLVAGLLPRVLIYASVIPASIWWPHLERAFLAWDDLDCAELLS